MSISIVTVSGSSRSPCRSPRPVTADTQRSNATHNGAEGLIDIYDHKPLVLTPEVAREWLDPTIPLERMTEIARTGSDLRPISSMTLEN